MGQALIRVSHKDTWFNNSGPPFFNLNMNYRANRIQQVYLLLRCSR